MTTKPLVTGPTQKPPERERYYWWRVDAKYKGERPTGWQSFGLGHNESTAFVPDGTPIEAIEANEKGRGSLNGLRHD